MDIINYFYEQLGESEEYKSFKEISDNINSNISEKNMTKLLETLGSPLNLIEELKNKTEQIILSIVKNHLKELFIENIYYETSYNKVLIKYSHQTKLYKTSDGCLNAPTCNLVSIDFEKKRLISHKFNKVFEMADIENTDRITETEGELTCLKEKLNLFSKKNPNKKEIADAFKLYGIDSFGQGLFSSDKIIKQYETIRENIEKEICLLETELIRYNQNDYDSLSELVEEIQSVILDKLSLLGFFLVNEEDFNNELSKEEKEIIKEEQINQ